MKLTLEQREQIKVWLKRTNQYAIAVCMGEANYPNASLRKVKLMESDELLFAEDGEGRTASLLQNSPEVLLLLLDENRGLKMKGKASFYEKGPVLEEALHLMKEQGKKWNTVLAVSIDLSDFFAV